MLCEVVPITEEAMSRGIVAVPVVTSSPWLLSGRTGRSYDLEVE